MEPTVQFQISFSTVVDILRQMPAEQLSRLQAELRRLLQEREQAAVHLGAEGAARSKGKNLAVSIAQMERGEVHAVNTPDELRQLIFEEN